MSQAVEPSNAPETPALKFSRYRGLRGISVSALPSTGSNFTNTIEDVPRTRSRGNPSATPAAPAPANSVVRSMSRYRQRAGSVSVDNNATPKITAPQQWEQSATPPVPTIPSTLKNDRNAQANFSFPWMEGSAAPIDQTRSSSPPTSQHHRQLRHTERVTRDLNRKASDHGSCPPNERDQRRMTGRDDRDRGGRRQDDEATVKYAERVARSQEEAERKLAKSKKKSLERLHVSLANGPQPDLRSPKTRSPVVEKFVALTRRRKSKDGLSPTSSTAGSIAGSLDYGSGHVEPPEVPKLPIGIEVGGRGIVPQTDAPVSAVNHGDRIVSVRCRHHTFILPVTPDTTPVDLVLATAKNMTYDLEWSPSECIVRESYGPLGLERRIRKYEHIRDVMNSWERDTHNHLIVTASSDPNQDHDLDIDSVLESEGAPSGIQLYIYHSNRPGKWNKRWITLADNGQIFSARKPDASPSDKDTISLCHLSDYDIYNPTESQMRRQLKPPKRNCFAVKSQHKPAMFVDTENYVQYFSMEDSRIATQFAQKVQSWRSWYLVDRIPAKRRISIPKTDDKPPQLPTLAGHVPKKSAVSVVAESGHRLKISVDESPYNIGEFEPLIDMRRFDKRISLFGQDFLPAEPDPSTMPKHVPNHLKKEPKDDKPDGPLIDKIKSTGDDAFTGNGLLGSDYAARKASIDREAANPRVFSKDAGDFGKNAFMDGPSLLNKQSGSDNPIMGETSWFPSALEHSAKYRGPEQRRPNTSAGVVTTGPTGRSRSHSQSRLPPIPQQYRTRSDRPPISHPHPLTAHDPRSPSGGPNHVGTGQQRHPPKPLVNLTTPIVNEPPQWSSRKGHGVHAPEGMHHLVDLISVGGPKDKPNGLLEVPPRSAMRRAPPNSAPLLGDSTNTSPQRSGGGLSRTRSKSSGAPPGRPLIDDVPPVPILPGAIRTGTGRTMTMGDADRAEMDAMREAMQARERDFKERERGRVRERGRGREATNDFHSTGRAGTLKVV